MILEFLTMAGFGFLGGVIGFYLFFWSLRRSLYSLSVDVATLQDQHLRSVRRSAAKERWDERDELDEKIVGALKQPEQKKGWTKWPSSGPSVNS